MNESFKAYRRRYGDKFWDGVFSGHGLVVGDKSNDIYREWYPNIVSIERWNDRTSNVNDFKCESFDFVLLGECLEHEKFVFSAMLGWLSLLKVGGNMIITVPDYNLYEGGVWPSRFNREHKWSFSMMRQQHENDICVCDLISKTPNVEVRRMSLIDTDYDYSKSGVDQTLGEAECCIEVVLRKLPSVSHKRTYRHSGARGDLIYSLPSIKSLGGGTLYVNRTIDHHFGIDVSDTEMKSIVDFLKTQSCFDDVQEWKGQPFDVDLDLFRQIDSTFLNLSRAHLLRFGIGFNLTSSWIEADKIQPVNKADIIVSRTSRYHSPFDWSELRPWIERAMFVGSKIEYDDFVDRTGLNIGYCQTDTWAELAAVILGSKLFIGNQSMAYAMAEGMKHPRVLESCLFCPNCDPLGKDGYVRLTQGVIRKYVLGEPYECTNRVSRSPFMQKGFCGFKRVRGNVEDISYVLVGSGEKAEVFSEACLKNGSEVFVENDGWFESSANKGIAKTTKQIICVVDVENCPSVEVVDSVVKSIVLTKSGMMTTSISHYGKTHVSGPCFAVTRATYEKSGLFNLSLKHGEASMLEMVLRYSKAGIMCGGLGLPKLSFGKSNEEDESLNRAYLERNFGVRI